jgi:uncharacterized protein YegL
MEQDRKLGDGIVKQELNLIFVVDKSGSMEGANIGSVNNAIRDVLSIMPEIQNDTSDATIKISALTFESKVNWVYSEPKEAKDFLWSDLDAEGGTDMSAAFDSLSGFLLKKSKGGKMPDIGGVAPIILFMTDGEPTSQDWEEHLNALKKHGWFRAALRYSLAISDDRVLKVYTAEALRKVIKVIAVTASKVKSSSASVMTSSSQGSATTTPTNNSMAQSQITDQLQDVANVEW